MERIILHIDFDSFFASAEQQIHPEFRNKPLGITAANSRTCIIAASREAKKFGVKTGSRSFEAFEKCPGLILRPANFVNYFEISKKFLNIAKDYSPFVEMFSIDEVFIDLTSTHTLFGGTDEVINRIKTRISKEIGEYITVSVGISHNKLLSKMASSINKPNGIFKVDLNNFEEFYEKAELTDVCGIGERIKNRLNLMGIYTLFDLKNASIDNLLFEFGKAETAFLRSVALGIDESEVIPYYNEPDVKSVGRNYCLPKNEYDKRVVLQNIYELCEEIGIKLRRLGKKGRTVAVFIGGSVNFGKRKSLNDYFDKGSEIFAVCKSILDNHYASFALVRKNASSAYCRQLSISVSSLEDSKSLTLSLFEETNKQDKLSVAIDKINDKFGDHAIRNGFLLYADKLTTVPNGYMADKYERIKLASNFKTSQS